MGHCRVKSLILSIGDAYTGVNAEVKEMAKKEKLDPETEALIKWCIEVEGFLVAGGATVAQAQEHIEEQVEWFTDLFYEGLTPEEAAKAALNG
jgi:hypothetical protein